MNCPATSENQISIDRRAARTRGKLHRGLMALCRSRRFESITVQDICRESGVGRSSFYAHFASKEALRKSGLGQMKADLEKVQVPCAQADGAMDSLPILKNVFELAARHVEWHHQDRGDDSPIAIVREAAVTAIRREAHRTDMAIDCLSGALDLVLKHWLDGGAREEPSTMSEAFCQAFASLTRDHR